MATSVEFRLDPCVAVRPVLCVFVCVIVLTLGKPVMDSVPVIVQENQCSALVNHRLINLAPLASQGFKSRFQARFGGWTYSFNPCLPLNIPDDPSQAGGDRCAYVSMCKSKRRRGMVEAYTLGIQHLVTFEMKKPTLPRKVKVHLTSTLSPPVKNASLTRQPDFFATTKQWSSENGIEILKREKLDKEDEEEERREGGEAVRGEEYIDDENEDSKLDDQVGRQKEQNGEGIKEEREGENNLDNREEILIDDEEETPELSQEPDILDGSGGGPQPNVDEENSGDMLIRGTTHKTVKNQTKKIKTDLKEEERDEEETGEDDEFEKDDDDDFDDELEEEEEDDDEIEDSGDEDEDGNEDEEDIAVTTNRKRRRKNSGRAKREVNRSKKKKKRDFPKGKVPTIKMHGILSYNLHTTYIYLICDSSYRHRDSGKFKVLDSDLIETHIELHHLCCCPDSCIQIHQYNSSGAVLTSPVKDGDGGKGTSFWPPHEITWVVVTVFLILLMAILIGTTCCRSGGTRGPYTTLPGIHASRLTLESQESFRMPHLKFPSPDYLDYDSPKLKKPMPPVENGIIRSQDLEIRQRLGGGLFGDTYLGELGEFTISAKRLTVGVHKGQLTEMDNARLQDAVHGLSKFRHKNVVEVLGICFELRQPHVIKEYVDGDSLRDLLLHVNDGTLTFQRKVKMLAQAADGMVYLHSGRHPVLHRDLRCANLLVSKVDDHVKITDFGMVELLHKLRVQCTGRKGCYCRKDTPAWPASIRWTAPEVLTHPTSEERESDVFTPACDVYSFALTMWEAVSVSDPWCELQDESLVVQTVLKGVRLDVSQLPQVPTPFTTLMQAGWQENPDKRPPFKQILGHLISVAKLASKEERKRRDSNSSTMTYFRSALNISVE